jgi:hypothetical protein
MINNLKFSEHRVVYQDAISFRPRGGGSTTAKKGPEGWDKVAEELGKFVGEATEILGYVAEGASGAMELVKGGVGGIKKLLDIRKAKKIPNYDVDPLFKQHGQMNLPGVAADIIGFKRTAKLQLHLAVLSMRRKELSQFYSHAAIEYKAVVEELARRKDEHADKLAEITKLKGEIKTMKAGKKKRAKKKGKFGLPGFGSSTVLDSNRSAGLVKKEKKLKALEAKYGVSNTTWHTLLTGKVEFPIGSGQKREIALSSRLLGRPKMSQNVDLVKRMRNLQKRLYRFKRENNRYQDLEDAVKYHIARQLNEDYAFQHSVTDEDGDKIPDRKIEEKGINPLNNYIDILRARVANYQPKFK